MIVRAARDVTKNVSVVVAARECLDHPRKGERREEGRQEGRKGRRGGEFFGQSTYQPRPAAASFLARRQASARARFSRSPPGLHRRNEHEEEEAEAAAAACEENGFAFVCRGRRGRTLTD